MVLDLGELKEFLVLCVLEMSFLFVCSF